MSAARTRKATLIGGATAAFAASVCCVGPLALVALGVGGAWISNLTMLEPYRPIFIGAALVSMGFAWRSVFLRPATENCAPGGECATARTNGVEKVAVTYGPKEAVVTFDDARISVDKLRVATANAGYPSVLKVSK